MDPKKAKELIEEVIREVDAAAPRAALRPLMQKVIRPAGLGLMLSLGVSGLLGCSDGGDENRIPPGGDAYGIPDLVVDLQISPSGDAYGLISDYGPADLSADMENLPAAGDAYGVPDGSAD